MPSKSKGVFFQMDSNKWAYLAAAVMSVFFFTFGITTGILINQSSVEYTTEQIQKLEGQIENAQLEYIYLNTMGDKLGCDSMTSLVASSTSDVWAIGQELVTLDRTGQTGYHFRKLKREYTLLSVKAWILNEYLTEKCGSDAPAIMYFYSVPCDDCITQGHILDDIRRDHIQDMKVFVVDYSLDEPIVRTLKSSHNVEFTPALIIGNKTYSGLQTKDSLLEILQDIS
jgi:hypothetical protein